MKKSKNTDFKRAKELLASSRHLCVLTGAGISAESGIRTFRDAGGLWEEHPIEKVATPQGFAQDPELVWGFYNARREAAHKAVPNAAHLALARMEIGMAQKMKRNIPRSNGNKTPSFPAVVGGPDLPSTYSSTGPSRPLSKSTGGRDGEPIKPYIDDGSPTGALGDDGIIPPMTILTQNIDGLHQQAGSQKVVELHGSIWKIRCTRCDNISTDFPIQLPILPYCGACRGLLRPHIVWFGEHLEENVLKEADRAVQGCDLFLVIGTSAVVQPAASYPFMAAARKIPVIEVNMESTSVSAIATVCLQGKAGEILPEIISA